MNLVSGTQRSDTSMALDLDAIRARFPALDSPWALFDNAGGSVVAEPVIDAMTQYVRTLGVQLGASYGLSQRATERVRAGHVAAASLLGADVEDTILGASTTTNLKTMARAVAPLMEPGDEIVLTELDHEANLGCWRQLAQEVGLTVRTWPVQRATASLEIDDLLPLLSPRTRLVAFTHCANVVGALVDVRSIVDAIRGNRPDTIVCVDGVAYAPHRQIDVEALDVDLYAFSAYKVFGPHLGVLYGRKDLLRRARGQNHAFIGEDQLPYKFEPGGVPHELAASLVGVIAYLDGVAAAHGITAPAERERHARVFELFARHEAVLAERLLAVLREHPRVRIVGPTTADPALRVPTIAFTVDGLRSSEVPPRVDERHVAIRFGDFYAPRAIEALGLTERDGIVRVSMVHYNTVHEVDRLIDALLGVS